MNILVTGGAGYLGSHTIVELIKKGHEVCILDNFSNSNQKVLSAIEKLTGVEVPVYNCDLRDYPEVDYVFGVNNFDAVIHFAARKYVGESVEDPLLYFDNNIVGIVNLLQVMKSHEVKRLIFSSSSTVYGDSVDYPFRESQPRGLPTNPYGRTKFMCEDILTDLCYSDPEWQVVLLRYFNPVGAHPSGDLGEDAGEVPPNVMPYIVKVAQGKLPKLNIFGGDYPTPDGTGVRDYIHVCDLASAHVAALGTFEIADTWPQVFNIGTGVGFSVLELVETFSRINGVQVPYEIVGRREGDVACSYCDVGRIKTLLGWESKFGLDQMCKDAWNWACKHPNGYED